MRRRRGSMSLFINEADPVSLPLRLPFLPPLPFVQRTGSQIRGPDLLEKEEEPFPFMIITIPQRRDHPLVSYLILHFALSLCTVLTSYLLIVLDSHIPHNTIIPNQAQHYTISDLLSLAPQARIASSQLEGVHSAMDLIASTMSKSGAKDKRRTPGRGREQPKAQRVSVAAEGPKRRRGIWGWNPHHESVQVVEAVQAVHEQSGAGVVAEGNWRHSPALVFSQA